MANVYGLTLCAFLLLNVNEMTSAQAKNSEQTLHKDGRFIIEALLPITRNGRLLNVYAITSEVIKRTIDDINRRTDILPTVQLGYDIVDDKVELNMIMKRAIGIVAKYRPESICREDEEFCTADQHPGPLIDKRVSAVIGPASSRNSVPSASLLGLYNIPQVGFTASSSILSDKSRFKSFLRTIPSDKYQAEAIASFVKYFGWNYVFFLGNDDEYGRQGLAAFKTAARKLKVCTALDVNIPFERTEDSKKQIQEIVREMKKQPGVRVAVLFMFERESKEVLQEVKKQGLKNMTWILSEAIGPNINNYDIDKSLLHGAFGVDFVYQELPEVEQYLSNTTFEEAASNPWMVQLFEETLNCTSKATPGRRKCQKDDKLDFKSLNIETRWSILVNIINSVKAIAHGLDNLLNCNGQLPNSHCPNTSFPLNGKDLYTYIRRVNFTGAMGERVSFDESGDLNTKTYTFRNVVLNRTTDKLDFRTVANWSSLMPASPTFFASGQTPDEGYGLTWNNGKVATATCSEECQPGEKQVGQSDCCWACHPCPKGEISNITGATECFKCPSNWYANEKQTQCLKTSIDYVDSSDAFSIVIIVISSIGLVAMVAVASLFYYVRDTPLIQDSNPILLGLLVLSITMGLVFSIFEVSLYRTDDGCRFLGAFLLFDVILVASTLLAKTKTCDSYVRKLASHYLKPVVEYSTLIMIGALLFFQLLLVGIWFLTDTPVVHFMKSSQALHIRECNSNWSAGRLIVNAFPLLVLFIATAFAFKERDERKNHHEAKYISFCTISVCILLIAFFPTYRFAQGLTTSVVIATTALVGALAVFGCILVPKLYIVLVQPERNVPEEERDHTVSSAHTTGGSQHRPVFSEIGEELRPANDVDLSTSASNTRENGVVKDIPVI